MSASTLTFTREQLVSALADEGVRFLAGGDDTVPRARIAAKDLIGAIVADPDPRLRLALTALFLLHPEYHAFVPDFASQLGGSAKIELQARYQAAVYLQRLWKTRLGYYLSDDQFLPDYFSRELGLPPPEERFGKTGLIALAELHARQSDFPYNHQASYQKSLELLIGQLKAEGHRLEFATAG
jgi:hypothetical protein